MYPELITDPVLLLLGASLLLPLPVPLLAERRIVGISIWLWGGFMSVFKGCMVLGFVLLMPRTGGWLRGMRRLIRRGIMKSSFVVTVPILFTLRL